MVNLPIYFNGGPCDGTNRQLTEQQKAVGVVTCRGTTYVYDKKRSRGYDPAVFSPAALVRAEAKGARSFDPTAVAAAWSRLTHALAHGAPHHIRRQHAATARLRRLARTGRM